jgi:hypothetical protein
VAFATMVHAKASRCAQLRNPGSDRRHQQTGRAVSLAEMHAPQLSAALLLLLRGLLRDDEEEQNTWAAGLTEAAAVPVDRDASKHSVMPARVPQSCAVGGRRRATARPCLAAPLTLQQ